MSNPSDRCERGGDRLSQRPCDFVLSKIFPTFICFFLIHFLGGGQDSLVGVRGKVERQHEIKGYKDRTVALIPARRHVLQHYRKISVVPHRSSDQRSGFAIKLRCNRLPGRRKEGHSSPRGPAMAAARL